MKASRDIKRAINAARRQYGKKNGVIGAWWFDRPWMWPHEANNKRGKRQTKRLRAQRPDVEAVE